MRSDKYEEQGVRRDALSHALSHLAHGGDLGHCVQQRDVQQQGVAVQGQALQQLHAGQPGRGRISVG